MKGSSRHSRLNVEVELVFEFGSDRLAETVYQALKPDNVMIPKGLRLSMKVKGSGLVVRLSSGNIKTLLSTANDIFECCDLAVGAVKVAKC